MWCVGIALVWGRSKKEEGTGGERERGRGRAEKWQNHKLRLEEGVWLVEEEHEEEHEEEEEEEEEEGERGGAALPV